MHLENAISQIRATQLGSGLVVRAFFDEATYTGTYVVHDSESRHGAVIDSVLDFDAAAGRTSTGSADAVIAYVQQERLKIDWLLETHAHADHLSAAPYLQSNIGGKLAIGRKITQVQHTFSRLFNLESEIVSDGSQFDSLLDDGAQFNIGAIPVTALHVPGHTPADVAYVIGDALFTGDTLFMPDYGTARADFPGGDARQLFRSIRRLLALPDETRMFLCHDYKAPGRLHFAWETTVRTQRLSNVHIHDGVTEEAFVAMRTQRDKTLGMPKLLLPAIQVNIRAGHFPPPESNGTRYLKLPLDVL
jgi:glyoxylase-like metal-dependent hydrolase (beta-lactamase superfamily II)